MSLKKSIDVADRFPNEEQRAVLESTARISLVRAGPGSGKTRVFVQAFKTYLQDWEHKRKGIAALSFTNVAQEEIKKRLGSPPPTPHFIGTLDSFFFRFVVRPFANIVGVRSEGTRLVPSPLDEMVTGEEIVVGNRPGDRTNVFRVRFSGGTEDEPELQFDEGYQRAKSIPQASRQFALNAKKQEWAKTGRITHSDCHYLASRILRHPKLGPEIIQRISLRFPVILVDELQDTGWFLSRALTALLGSPQISGLVIGDPDQAIYEFAGASPNIFSDIQKLSDVQTFELNRSHRCSHKVANVASHLSEAKRAVIPADGAGEGRAVIVVHQMDEIVPDGSLISEFNRLCNGNGTALLLARRNATIGRFIGNTEQTAPLPSKTCKNILRAVVQLRVGKPGIASAIVGKELGSLIFDDPLPNSRTLTTHGVTMKQWRKAIHKILIGAMEEKPNESWNDWVARIKKLFHAQALSLGWVENKLVLGARFKSDKKEGHLPRNPSSPTQQRVLPFTTTSSVHAAKGTEHDVTIFLSPKPHGLHAPCPSIEWWPNDQNSEEKRIAFVAVSRARKTIVLCLHHETVQALKTRRPEFFSQFEVIERPLGSTKTG